MGLLGGTRVSQVAHQRVGTQWEAQRTFDELGRPLREMTFCVVDLETTGGSAEAGSMITEIGAVKVRGGEVLGEFQTLVNPHTAIPPFIAVLTGITNSMVADAPTIESALPAVPRVRRRLRAGRPQRALRRRVPAPLRRGPGPAVAGVRGARHRPAGPPGDHPRRRPQLQAVVAGQGVPLRHDPQPPRPRRRPGDRRRAPRADGAAGRSGRPHPRGAPDVLLARQPARAPQAPPRRAPPPRAGRLPVPRRARARPLRRHLPRPAQPRPLLLHLVRDPQPDGRDGRRWPAR